MCAWSRDWRLHALVNCWRQQCWKQIEDALHYQNKVSQSMNLQFSMRMPCNLERLICLQPCSSSHVSKRRNERWCTGVCKICQSASAHPHLYIGRDASANDFLQGCLADDLWMCVGHTSWAKYVLLEAQGCIDFFSANLEISQNKSDTFFSFWKTAEAELVQHILKIACFV